MPTGLRWVIFFLTRLIQTVGLKHERLKREIYVVLIVYVLCKSLRLGHCPHKNLHVPILPSIVSSSVIKIEHSSPSFSGNKETKGGDVNLTFIVNKVHDDFTDITQRQ